MSNLLSQVSANGALIDVLIKEFGPILAQLIIRWMSKKEVAHLAGATAGFDPTSVLRHLVASQLRAHEDEILAQINAETKSLFEAGVNALDA